jgi:ABC-type Fe3+ transport system substrate-binding protein
MAMISRRQALLLPAYALALDLAAGSRPAAAGDSQLIDAAKQEGEVVWYTGLIVSQVVQPLQEGFRKKYGINVSFVSVGSQEAAVRILTEGRVGAIKADLFDGSAPFEPVSAAGLILPYKPQEAAGYPEDFKDPSGLWTAQMIQITGPAINTTMVTPEQAPKRFEDLLDPRWQGAMAWSNSEEIAGPPGFIGNVLMTMGQDKGMDYLKKLADQKIASIPSNFRVVLDQAIAAQYPMVLSVFNYHTAISRAQGAPVEWIALERSTLTVGTISLLKNSSHPNAGKLFLEYCLSEEGQRVTRDAGYIPADPRVPAKDPSLKPEAGHFQVNVISPDLFHAHSAEWIGIYRTLFQ